MGTTSLILGLDDVVDNLTQNNENNEALSVLRWVLSCCDREVEAVLALEEPRIQWSIIRLCRTFASQNRTDIVGAIWSTLETIGVESLLNRLSAIPRSPWILATPARPRLDLRESITSVRACQRSARSIIGFGHLRDVFRGERVLLIGYDVNAPLFEHADLRSCSH